MLMGVQELEGDKDDSVDPGSVLNPQLIHLVLQLYIEGETPSVCSELLQPVQPGAKFWETL